MQMLIQASGGSIEVKASGQMELTHRTAADLLKAHSRLIGRLIKASGNTGKTIDSVRNSLNIAFLAVMGGQSPAGEKPYYADSPIAIIYDLETGDAHFAVTDGSMSENPVGGLLLIFVRLAGMIAGDIDYVFFSEKILEAFDKGVKEAAEMAAKED